jgi:Holliday junction resolvase
VATIYASGRSFEYRVRDLFRARNWLVGRSAGSHTAVDLFCIPPGENRRTVLIQCKFSVSPYLSKKELHELRLAARDYDVDVFIVAKNDDRSVQFYDLDFQKVQPPYDFEEGSTDVS